jgi:regulator of protease activity HflC (stomatin/prohibitin superfamily)
MRNFLFLLAVVFLTSCGWETIDTGHRGVLTNYGKVDHKNVLGEGFHTYNPITYSLHELDVRTEKQTGELSAYSKDSQTIKITYAYNVNAKPEVISHLFEKYGTAYFDRVVPQRVESRIKNAIGQHEAMEVIAKRAAITTAMEKELTDALSTLGFNFNGLELVNIDFDDSFEAAIREKVVAVQNGIKAENETVRIREESKQAVIKATADAESMKIRSQALSANKNLVEYEAVQKWNGVLPVTMMGQSVPFINLK